MFLSPNIVLEKYNSNVVLAEWSTIPIQPIELSVNVSLTAVFIFETLIMALRYTVKNGMGYSL